MRFGKSMATRLVGVALASVALGEAANAAILASYADLSNDSNNNTYSGQSINLGGLTSDTYNNLVFSWLDRSGNPIAPGTLLIFEGIPQLTAASSSNNLNDFTALASVVGSAGPDDAYELIGLTLHGDTTYSFFVQGNSAGSGTGSGTRYDTSPGYVGGAAIEIGTSNGSCPNRNGPDEPCTMLGRGDLLFRLSGDVVQTNPTTPSAVPEPASLSLLGLGLLGLGFSRRKHVMVP